MSTFMEELRSLINRFSKENGSNTSDIILADFLSKCLDAFDAAVVARDKWYGVELEPGKKKFIRLDDDGPTEEPADSKDNPEMEEKDDKGTTEETQGEPRKNPDEEDNKEEAEVKPEKEEDGKDD